jgi:hypothetical protein
LVKLFLYYYQVIEELMNIYLIKNMINKDGEYSFKDLYNEIKKKAKDKTIQSDYEYLDLVDEIIDEKKKEGYFSEAEDFDQLRDDLEAMWPEVEQELQK